MIITKTPVRVSLLGGGTDLPVWSRKHGGVVLGGAISKYSYVSARFLPPFHDHKSRVVYSKIELVGDNREIEHRAVNACVADVCPNDPLEIMHQSDLPGRSGTGSSSTFVVGLLNALSSLHGQRLSPQELASRAIEIEQKRLGETVGAQDQTFAAFGGLNTIEFRRDGEIVVKPMVLNIGHIRELESHLMLFFTRVVRTSSEVSSTYAPTLDQKLEEQFTMMRLAEQGIEAVYNRYWERLGNLIDQSWRIKAGLSSAVTTAAINEFYTAARVGGAWGGKITGAGGGGCLLLVVPPEKHERVKKLLVEKGCVHVPFRFEFSGSSVIFADPHGINNA